MNRSLLLPIVLLAGFTFAQTNSTPASMQTNPSTAKGKAQAEPSKPAAQAKPVAQSKPAPAANGFEKALEAMDKAAAGFQTAQSDFEWDQYEAVVKDTTVQKGMMYIRRNGNDIEMVADITDPPDSKQTVLFQGGKVQLYQPKLDQITQYSAGKNKEAFQSFLVLGFGGRGHDLTKQFEVKYEGTEKVQGIDAAKLELSPKSQRVRGMFNPILLWIDPARGVSVQQQFVEPGSGNYRLVKYSNIKLNQKLPNDVFRLKTTGKTKIVTPGL